MDYYDFIIATIKEAGALLLEHYRGDYKSDTKHDDPRDLVTEIDFKINNFLISKIKTVYPAHGIYSEEGSGLESASEYLWTIDPIDGTANFSRGIPHFAVCLGLLQNNVPIAGAVLNPITAELFSFKNGFGSFLNGKSIKVSSISDISKSFVLMVTGRRGELRDWGTKMYRKLLDRANHTRNLASSSLDVCFVADGRVEAAIYGQLNLVDISSAAGILLEAGGKITDLNGKKAEITDTKPQKLIFSNGTQIHQTIIDEIV